jgi:preprotein translocase subunit SecB
MQSHHSDEISENKPERVIFPLPYEIQLQNTFAVEISAKKFPISLSEEDSAQLSPDINLSFQNIQVNEQSFEAQVLLAAHISFPSDPRLFEISFKLLGLFTYTDNFTTEQVHMYLEKGALSILLPFARELLSSICIRLQVPVFLIPMIPISPNLPEKTNAQTE